MRSVNGDQPANPIPNYITPLEDGPDGFKHRGPSGLTKLEVLAGMAMQGLLSNVNLDDQSLLHHAKLAIDSAEYLLEEMDRRLGKPTPGTCPPGSCL